jgi:hypothetical protein
MSPGGEEILMRAPNESRFAQTRLSTRYAGRVSEPDEIARPAGPGAMQPPNLALRMHNVERQTAVVKASDTAVSAGHRWGSSRSLWGRLQTVPSVEVIDGQRLA